MSCILKIETTLLIFCPCYSSVCTAIFIVVDIRKNMSRKTEFKLVQIDQELVVTTLWTLLKRSKDKVGREFVPMRKVLFDALKE